MPVDPTLICCAGTSPAFVAAAELAWWSGRLNSATGRVRLLWKEVAEVMRGLLASCAVLQRGSAAFLFNKIAPGSC